MKFPKIVISGSDILERISTDSDWPIRECCDTLGVEPECVQDDAYGKFYAVPQLSGFWLISWPNHVINPRYNSDANYQGPYSTAAEAADGVENVLYYRA